LSIGLDGVDANGARDEGEERPILPVRIGDFEPSATLATSASFMAMKRRYRVAGKVGLGLGKLWTLFADWSDD